MSFTVVIPACGRSAQLARCLGMLPADAGVIVSDDSRDDAVKQMLACDFQNVRWLRGPRRGPAANRNNGARAAVGEWIAFLDDDCEPQPGWLAAFAAVSAEADVIEGRTVAPGATDSPFEEHVENPNGDLFWSCNLAVRRDVFAQLGGFDEDFTEAGGEDMEFGWRIRHSQLRVRFALAALVHHPPRRIGWRGLWRRTWMIRWMPLYRRRTGQVTSLMGSVLREIADLLRVTLHLVTRPEPGGPRRRVFAVFWRWITFPAVLPWLLYWELHFRKKEARP